MFSKKSTIIATILIAFTYLVCVPLVYAAKEYKMTDYWPLKEGAWWEFNDGKIEITSTEEIDGISTFKSLDTGSCSGDEEVGGEFYFYFFNDDANGFGLFFQDEDGSYIMVKISEPYVKKGDKTKVSIKKSDGRQETVVFKLEGTANVVVPAGKFKRCLRFSVKVEGVDDDGNDFYYTERFYLAKGVGLVKAVRVKESENNDVGCAFGPISFDVFNGIRKLKDYFQKEPVSIEGHVYDGTMHPIEGAVVSTSLDSQTATTDSTGYFFLQTNTLANYSITPYTITISASGYQTFSESWAWGDHPTSQTFYLCGISDLNCTSGFGY